METKNQINHATDTLNGRFKPDLLSKNSVN